MKSLVYNNTAGSFDILVSPKIKEGIRQMEYPVMRPAPVRNPQYFSLYSHYNELYSDVKLIIIIKNQNKLAINTPDNPPSIAPQQYTNLSLSVPIEIRFTL